MDIKVLKEYTESLALKMEAGHSTETSEAT
jgi:hypothetical protein